MTQQTKSTPVAARRPWRSGNSLVEMAFVMTLLLILSMGVIEFGQFFYIRHAFGAAAREAARQAGVESATNAGVQAVAAATLMQANVVMDSSWFQAYDIPPTGGPGTPVTDLSTIPTGDRVQITIATTYGQVPNAFRPLYQLFGKGIGSAKPIAGTCTTVRE